MNRLRLLLLPFSLLYGLIMTLRNGLFNLNLLKSKSYALPVISVGNITVGGTGKTPVTEHIIEHLQRDFKCALLSRGYGRKTKGVLLADKNSDYESVGDEPKQLKDKFPKLDVCVAEKRVLGMEKLLAQAEPPEVVVMDDAFQHRYVKPGLSIVVTDYFRPMHRDFCFPAGNLREPACGASRADIILVNKCPENLSHNEAETIKKQLKIKPHQLLFFTAIQYDELQPLVANPKTNHQPDNLKNNAIAIAGIGNPAPFFEKMQQEYGINKCLAFADHHPFSTKEIELMGQKAGENGYIVTTEKDAVRLRPQSDNFKKMAKRIWYLPIKVKFLFDAQKQFDNKIDDYVRQV